MSFIYFACFILISVGIILALNLTPEQLRNDISALINREKTLRDRSLSVRGKKKTRRFVLELRKIKTALEETGKEKQFSVACMTSIFLMIGGSIIAIVMSNPFLIPVLALAFGIIPFVYLKRTIDIYDNHIKEELETALSIITTSYVRNDNIINAVSENIAYLKPPVRGIFEGFLAETTNITPDIRITIAHLKEKISETIFEEWCETLLACQNDRTLKDTLMPIVSKLTDVRLVNNSLKTMLAEARREYYMMVIMVLANIPLLYFLNKDWYSALMFTTFGKLVLAICGFVIIFTAIRMNSITKPIEYKR